MSDSKDYYARRAEEESDAAARAEDPRAAETHRQLAEHYSTLSQTIDDNASAEQAPTEPGILPREFRIVP